MVQSKNDILQGTLALLILKTLASGGPNARLRDHGAHSAHLGGPAARGGRLPLSGPSPHGAAALAECRMGLDRQEPPGALLYHHQRGPKAVAGRGRELGTAV